MQIRRIKHFTPDLKRNFCFYSQWHLNKLALVLQVKKVTIMSHIEMPISSGHPSGTWHGASNEGWFREQIMLNEHTEPVHICPGCSKVYRYRRGLNFHLKNECGKDPHVQCPFCPHRSKQKGNVVAHIRIKHPEQDVDSVKSCLQSIYC